MEEDALFKDNLDFRDNDHIDYICDISKCSSFKYSDHCIQSECYNYKLTISLTELFWEWMDKCGNGL